MIGQKRVPSREGGVEIVVWELATRLRDRGYEIDCYNRSGYHVSARNYDHIPGKRGVYDEKIRIITVPTLRNGKLNAIIYSVLATIRALFGHYDVIHFHAEGPCLMIWLPRLFGIRVIATIHGLDWQRAKWGNFASRMLKNGEKMAAKHADELIVLSKSMQDYFMEQYGRKTWYIPNGISRPVKREPEIITQKYGLYGEDYFLTLSRIVPEKGLHYLLEAFRNIQTDKKLVIAGGSSNAVEYMDLIKKMALEDKRVILTDFVHGEELEELLSNAYVYCLPSDIEGMSISLLEAMSYGRCCLVSNIPENAEVVAEHAVMFQHGNRDDLQKKIELILNNENLHMEYENQASDYICKKYSWDKMVKETERLYYGENRWDS
ncbi:MAG: glycosyltransferase family 4 protein [Butyrivibrio sp.]|jgi:glycosyltransferase involved in cell wall biosynthesis|nr:glycosyltransferase family 4 protein [Butyrivibrio sp.]